MENYPKWLLGFAKKISSVIGFFMLWTILSLVINVFNQPTHNEPSKYFQVCILENNQPKLVNIASIGNATLCQQEYDKYQLGAVYFMSLQRVNVIKTANPSQSTAPSQLTATEWKLSQWNDSLGDPFVYYYQTTGNKVQPLWQSHGGMMATMTSWIGGLFISAILWFFAKMVIRKRS